MTTVSYLDFVRIIDAYTSKHLRTAGGNKTFTVRREGESVVFTPSSTGQPRKANRASIERYIAHFNLTGSIVTSDYSDSHRNRSYVLSVLELIKNQTDLYKLRARDIRTIAKPSLPLRVRIVPMAKEESQGWTIKKQQDRYFLKELSGNLNGKYHCHTLLNAPSGTPVLFQYQGHIIASARLLGGEKLPRPTPYGYAKAMSFEPSSICVFEPVTPEQMQAIWLGEFKKFSQATKKLSVEPLSRFFELVYLTVKTTNTLGSVRSETPGGWMASDKAHIRSGTTATEVSADHAKMQRTLVTELGKQYGAKNVITEQDHIDVRVTTDSEDILFEIKADHSPAAVIRNAIGQLLEYAFLVPKPAGKRRMRLVIVGRNETNDAERRYVDRLKTEFRLPISYRTVAA